MSNFRTTVNKDHNLNNIYENSLRMSKTLNKTKTNYLPNKLNYEEFSNNDTNQFEDLEKFYESRQQKIEDILYKKSNKQCPQFINKSNNKNEDLKKLSTRLNNNHSGSTRFSPKSSSERPKSAITKINSKSDSQNTNKIMQNYNKNLKNNESKFLFKFF